MQPKITIIVPIYNGEKYLARCLDSILSQTFNEIIVLAINDGSTDNSFKLIEKYSKKHPEVIRSLTQTNQGVAKTRNRGIILAKTKYLMFVDQDDYLDPDYCEVFFNAAEAGDYDIVLGGFKRPGAGKKIINRKVMLQDTPYAPYVCTGLFAKIHKTAFLKNNKIFVFETVFGEDIVFTLREYSKTNKIRVLNKYSGYNWYYNKESVSNTKHKKMLEMLPLLLVMLEETKNLDVRKSPEHEYYMMQNVIFYLLWGGRVTKPTDFIKAYRNTFEWMQENYPNFERNKYIPFGPKGAPLLNRFSIGSFMIIHRFRLVPLFSALYCRK